MTNGEETEAVESERTNDPCLSDIMEVTWQVTRSPVDTVKYIYNDV